MDPSQFITVPAGYGTGYPNPFGLNQPNFVYVRGVNTTTTAMTGRVWLYWAQSSMYLWAGTWQSAGVSVGGQMVNYQSLTVAAAPPWNDHTQPPPVSVPTATTMPFLVAPSVPATSDGFALIAMIDNAPTTPAIPPPLPSSFGIVGQLANWVSASGNVGWLDTTVSTVAPILQQTITVSRGGGGNFNVQASCYNLPTDGKVSLECAGPTYASSVNLYQQPVTGPNMTLSQQVAWPASFQTSACVTFWQGNTPPPSGASVRIVFTPV